MLITIAFVETDGLSHEKLDTSSLPGRLISLTCLASSVYQIADYLKEKNVLDKQFVVQQGLPQGLNSPRLSKNQRCSQNYIV